MSRAHHRLIAAYGRLARLHPPTFRAAFAAEMQAVFAALLAELPPGDPAGLLRLCLRELVGLLGSLAREHWKAALLRRTPPQRLALLAFAIYGLGLTLLAGGLYLASPGPRGQALLGVAIGRHDGPGGIAYLSGRRLSCAPAAEEPASSRCAVMVAGRPLELLARRNGSDAANQLGGVCSAQYAGREWPCVVGSRHVHTHWFAYLSEPLGLGPAELEALRRQHPVENLPERVFLQGLLLVPIITTLVVTAGSVLWGWGRRRQRPTLGRSLLLGAAAWVGALALMLSVTGGFWD